MYVIMKIVMVIFDYWIIFVLTNGGLGINHCRNVCVFLKVGLL